jgi:hypothetical protein
MRYLKTLVTTLVTAAITGCATTYQADSFTGGFTETRYAEDVYEVSFNGNGYTSEQRASDLALLRSAELTLKSGYKYFVVFSGDTKSGIYSYTTPKQTVTTGTVQTYGNTGYVNAQSQTYGGQTYNVAKPTATKIFKMFKEEPIQSPMRFNAAFICESIGSKYKVTCRASESTNQTNISAIKDTDNVLIPPAEEWRRVGSTAGSDIYVHNSSIQKINDLTRAWVLTEFRNNEIGDGAMSGKALMEFNCSEARMRNLQTTTFTGRTGTGGVVFQAGLEEWLYVPPDTGLHDALRFVCAARSTN